MKTKQEAIKEFREEYKDSSLFQSWDNCQNDLEEFISKVWDAGYKKAWDEAKETFDLKEVEL